MTETSNPTPVSATEEAGLSLSETEDEFPDIERVTDPDLLHKHIWTTGGPEDLDLIHLAVPEGHSVYFDCGPGGVILVSIEEDSLDLYGEMGNLSVRPVADAEVRVTVV
jgi:hypothetical protein